MTANKKSDYKNYLDFFTKEQNELRRLLSRETTIVRFLHLEEKQEYSIKLNRSVRILKMILEIVDPFLQECSNFYGVKIQLKMPQDQESDKVLKTVRSHDLKDIIYVLDLHKDHFKTPQNYKQEDLREDWKKRLFVCDDVTKIGYEKSPFDSISNIFAFEPKKSKSNRKIRNMKKSLDKVFFNYSDAQREMRRLNKKTKKQKPKSKPKKTVAPVKEFKKIKNKNKQKKSFKKPVVIDNLKQEIEDDLNEKDLFESSLTAEKTGLKSNKINLLRPNIDNKFISTSQMMKNSNYRKFRKENYHKTMQKERRNYPKTMDYKKDMSISKHKGKYTYQKGIYKGSNYKLARKQNHYDLKAREPKIYQELITACNYCKISKYQIQPLMTSPESIVKRINPLLNNCKKNIKKIQTPKWGLSNLQVLLYKLSQLPKDQIKFKAFVTTDKSKSPYIPNFDNNNPTPNKYGVTAQYQLKGEVQNAGPKYQNLKRALLNNQTKSLKINYSKF